MIISIRLLHITFWIFTFLYVFDYFVDEFELATAIGYSSFEVSVLFSEFYINLFVLIPLLLVKRNALIYSIALIAVMLGGFSIYILAGLDTELLSTSFPRALLSFFLNHSLFILISFMLWFFQRYVNERMKTVQLENEKLLLEMSVLKSQISPHFLFNTLNNIYSLSIAKDDDAPKMLAATSNILRYYVNNGQKKLVSINAEIEILQQYIETQKMRKLQGEISTEFATLPEEFVVPPLIILSLVENAFKHGDINTNKNGFVNISIAQSGNEVIVELTNSFNSNSEKNGVGLNNIRSQLDLIYKRSYSLELTEQDSNYSVILRFNGK